MTNKVMESKITFVENKPMVTWEYNEFKLEIYYIPQGFTERSKVGYRFYENSTLIFEGKDYSPSPLRSLDSDNSIFDLLGFLSMQEGDTDEEYFKDYTQEQKDFSVRCGEHLRLIVCDYESDGAYPGVITR